MSRGAVDACVIFFHWLPADWAGGCRSFEERDGARLAHCGMPARLKNLPGPRDQV